MTDLPTTFDTNIRIRGTFLKQK